MTEVSRNVVNVAGEMLTEDVEIRLPVSSHEACVLGKSQPRPGGEPADGRPGVPSVEEIRALLEKARPVTLGIILTKSPQGAEDAENSLESTTASGDGRPIKRLLLSDAPGWRRALSGRLEGFLSDGGEVYGARARKGAAGLSGKARCRGCGRRRCLRLPGGPGHDE